MKKGKEMNYESWDSFKRKVYTEEEISELDLKTDLICSIIDARNEQEFRSEIWRN